MRQSLRVRRLLHETLASVHLNFLHLIRVSLKRETSCPHSSSFLRALSSLQCFVFVALVLGQHGRAYAAGRGDSGTGGSRRCRGHSCQGGAYCRDFYPGGCCSVGQHCHLCRGCGRLDRPSRDRGTGAGVESGGEDHCGVSLCSRGCQRLFPEDHSP
jgi:hypothetical protein